MQLSSHTGKAVRLARILSPATGRALVIPMDHGMTDGPVPGLRNMPQAVLEAAEGGADAVILHKGWIAPCWRQLGGKALIMHLSASSRLSATPNSKVLVASVEEAVRLGADGVSIHINIGDAAEGAMLADAGRVADASSRWGMPLLMMIYARGPQIAAPYSAETIDHCVRIGAELGADMVKVPYCGDSHAFRDIVRACPVPLFVAGGEKRDSLREVLEMAHGCLQAGAAGLSMGRNIFQHPNPRGLTAVLAAMVHENCSPEDALNMMNEAAA